MNRATFPSTHGVNGIDKSSIEADIKYPQVTCFKHVGRLYSGFSWGQCTNRRIMVHTELQSCVCLCLCFLSLHPLSLVTFHHVLILLRTSTGFIVAQQGAMLVPGPTGRRRARAYPTQAAAWLSTLGTYILPCHLNTLHEMVGT